MKARNPMVVLYVHDMARAVSFYSQVVGLTVLSESAGWSMLSCDGGVVGLHVIAPGIAEGTAAFAGLCLEVDDLDAAVSEVERGGGRLRQIKEAEPPRVPVRLAELVDSEGNGFELRQVVG